MFQQERLHALFLATANPTLVLHSRDFPFPISRDPEDFDIPAFQENWSGIPGNMIYKVKMYILLAFQVFSNNCYKFA
jgi:hypothetical protein